MTELINAAATENHPSPPESVLKKSIRRIKNWIRLIQPPR